MSAKITGMIFESTLPPTQRLVLIALADRGSSDGRGIRPSIIDVASMTGISQRHVKRVLLKMKEQRIILVEEQAGYHSPNRYRINLAKLDKAARVEPLTRLPAFTPEQESRRVDAESIYAEYPRKTERQYAIRAIIKALKSNTVEYLMERTKLYASMVNGSDKTFVPYAQRWFNRERFNDDPSTWRIKEGDHDMNKRREELKRLKNKNSWTDAERARLHELKRILED